MVPPGRRLALSVAVVTKRELALLEKAFAAEIDAAIAGHGIHVVASKSKLAQKLVEDGLLEYVTLDLGRRDAFGAITVSGYQLTEAGRLAYCSTCSAPSPAERGGR